MLKQIITAGPRAVFGRRTALLVATVLLWPVAAAQPRPEGPPAEEACYKGKPTSFWIKKLQHKDVAARKEAVQALTVIGPEASAAVHALARALDDDETEIRLGALTALGAIGPGARDAVPAVMQAARDDDDSYRAVALRALGGIGPVDEAVLPTLVKELLTPRDSPASKACLAALESLKQIGPGASPALPDLTKALRSSDARVRSAMIPILAAIGGEGVPAVASALRDSDTAVRDQAILALRNLGPKARAAAPTIVEAFKERDNQTRRMFLPVLELLGPDAVPALVILLKEGDFELRQTALGSLRTLGPKARPALDAMLDLVQDRKLGPLVIQGLGAIGPDGVPPLLEALKSKNDWVHNNAFAALQQMGPQARPGIPALIEVLKANDANLRAQASQVLVSIGAEAVPALVTAIKDKDNDQAFLVLSQMAGRHHPSVPELTNLLRRSSEPRVRLRAVRLLGWVGKDALVALPDLREALADGDAEVRQAAETAIKQIERDR
jgi:HEAT repeat protein